jgi:hypothetical protein
MHPEEADNYLNAMYNILAEVSSSLHQASRRWALTVATVTRGWETQGLRRHRSFFDRTGVV